MIKVKWIDDKNRVRTDRIRDNFLDRLEATPPEQRSETLADILAWRRYNMARRADGSCVAIDIIEPPHLAGAYSVQIRNRVAVEAPANLLEAISAEHRTKPKVRKTWVPVHEALKIRPIWEEEIRSSTTVHKRDAENVVVLTPEQVEAMKGTHPETMAKNYPDLADFKGKRFLQREERTWARTPREEALMAALLEAVETESPDCTVRMSRCGYTGEPGVVLEIDSEAGEEARSSFESATGIPAIILERRPNHFVTSAFVPVHMLDRVPEIVREYGSAMNQDRSGASALGG